MTERFVDSVGSAFVDWEKQNRILFPGRPVEKPSARENRLVVEGFVEGNPDRVFSLQEMRAELTSPVSIWTCAKILDSLAVERLTGKNKLTRFRSLARKLTPTTREPIVDELGRQARNDFHELVRTRALSAKRHYRVIKKF